jgi:hypothetical protein
VLVFGVTLGNADALLRLLRRGGADKAADEAATEVVRAALGGHERTISFIRTLVFTMVGLSLTAPPWGPLVMGVALGVLLLVCRLAVARFTLTGLEHAERSIIAASAPRGMATVALATLPLAHAIPGAPALLTLVLAAVTTSIVLFTVGLRQLQASAARLAYRPTTTTPVRPQGPTLGSLVAAEVAASHPVPAPPVVLSATDIRAPTLRAFDDMTPAPQLPPVFATAPVSSVSSMTSEAPVLPMPPMMLETPHDEEDPLSTAMARALSRRPEEVTATRRRPHGDEDTFQRFTGPPTIDAPAVSPVSPTIPSDDVVEPPLQLDEVPPVEPERR